MVFHQFPDLQWLKKQAETNFSNRKAWGGGTLPKEGWPTVIMNATATQTYRDNIRGPLSIFTNISGTSSVECGSKRANINEDFFYVTNHDQHYTLDIGNKKQTETFNIHFGEYWADQALSSVVNNPDKLLNDFNFPIPHQRVELFNKLSFRSNTFNQIIGDLKNADNNSLKEEEKLYELLTLLLSQDQEIKKLAHRLPVIKSSTKNEILKRLLLSTDYIYSYYNKDINLDELAAVCCLSKFHFLRLFKIAFHKTPHQFINEVKVGRAKVMLKKNSCGYFVNLQVIRI